MTLATISATGTPKIGESAAAVPAGSVISLGSTVTLRAITVVAIGIPLASVKFPRKAGSAKVCNLEFCAVAASSGPRTICNSTSRVMYIDITIRKTIVVNLIRLRGLSSCNMTGLVCAGSGRRPDCSVRCERGGVGVLIMGPGLRPEQAYQEFCDRKGARKLEFVLAPFP
ncbi:unannotated protein [freshwater metagenome]|uniref:Unannotated protein n=1 Tax=freshwater metagenome TaxID=449393 RepID=A0A6J7T8X5_9ZZZZ